MISEHKFVPVIHRNTPLPATRSEMFTTAYDRQEEVRISIYQGENEDVRHNQFIGEFLLEGLSEVDAGNEILVRFGLDLNGILKVTAEEHATGLQKQLTVENAVSRFRRQSRPGGRGGRPCGSRWKRFLRPQRADRAQATAIRRRAAGRTFPPTWRRPSTAAAP